MDWADFANCLGVMLPQLAITTVVMVVCSVYVLFRLAWALSRPNR
jgi:hypothetical protein